MFPPLVASVAQLVEQLTLNRETWFSPHFPPCGLSRTNSLISMSCNRIWRDARSSIQTHFWANSIRLQYQILGIEAESKSARSSPLNVSENVLGKHQRQQDFSPDRGQFLGLLPPLVRCASLDYFANQQPEGFLEKSLRGGFLSEWQLLGLHGALASWFIAYIPCCENGSGYLPPVPPKNSQIPERGKSLSFTARP